MDSDIGWQFRARHITLTLHFVAFCAALTADAQTITGSIGGTVKDPQGAVVAKAAIKASNIETGFTRHGNSTGDGTFLVQYLPVGSYSLEVTAAGFQKYVEKNVPVAVDQTSSVTITLVVGRPKQTIEVTAEPALVDTTTAEIGRTISPSEVISLPLVNRNVYAELSLTPGVMANSASQQSNPSGTPNFQIGVPSQQVQLDQPLCLVQHGCFHHQWLPRHWAGRC